MKKSLLILATTLITPLAFATPVKSLMQSYLHLTENPNFNHWSVKTSIFSINSKVPSNIKNIQISYSTKLNYNFNKNLYASVSLIRHKGNLFGWSSTIGIQGSNGFIRPYIGANLTQTPRPNQVSLKQVGYDVGTNFCFTKLVVPFIEMDNFLQKDRESIGMGFSVALGNKMSISMSYSRYIQSKNDSIKLTFGKYF